MLMWIFNFGHIWTQFYGMTNLFRRMENRYMCGNPSLREFPINHLFMKFVLLHKWVMEMSKVNRRKIIQTTTLGFSKASPLCNKINWDGPSRAICQAICPINLKAILLVGHLIHFRKASLPKCDYWTLPKHHKQQRSVERDFVEQRLIGNKQI